MTPGGFLTDTERHAADAASTEAAHREARARMERNSGELATRDDLTAIATAFHSAVRRLPVSALEQVRPLESLAFSLSAAASSAPIADLDTDWMTIQGFYSGKGQ